MSKTPLCIRQDVEKSRERINVLAAVLRDNQDEGRQWLGEESARAAEALSRLLDDNTVPDD